jgi:hypothetical protein
LTRLIIKEFFDRPIFVRPGLFALDLESVGANVDLEAVRLLPRLIEIVCSQVPPPDIRFL